MTRRLPPYDKAKEAFIDKALEVPKTPPAPETKSDDLSIDGLLADGLVALNRMMKSILSEVRIGGPINRDTVQNLKDVMGVLKELKKDEQSILDNLSTEELEKIVNETRPRQSSRDEKET